MFQPQVYRYESMMGPWPEFRRLRREMDRFFRAAPVTVDYPAVNVWVGPEDAILTTELPGIDPEKLDISIINDVLKISGAREAGANEEGENCLRQERNCGPFSRAVQLPFSVDAQKVEAKYEKGILQIVLPRAEADKPKKITVR